jgi:hypothetical protein
MSKLLSSALAALLLSTPDAGPQDKPRDPASSLTFQSLDRDHDGKVTREEFADAFARLDRNHDGVITSDELSGRESRGPKGKKSKPGQGKRRR